MKKTAWILAAFALPLVTADIAAAAEAAAAKRPMSFFVTSVPIGNGGNLGGLEGADRHCQTLAQKVGAGDRTWHAYLSTQGPGAVNARDRIGKGPWYNAKGVMIAKDLGHLHGDTLEEARIGNVVNKQTAITEAGVEVPGEGDKDNHHDVLTGSHADGRTFTEAEDHTCKNWMSTSADAHGQVGHHDRNSDTNISWNSTHPTRQGCGQDKWNGTGVGGLFYCFAVN